MSSHDDTTSPIAADGNRSVLMPIIRERASPAHSTRRPPRNVCTPFARDEAMSTAMLDVTRIDWENPGPPLTNTNPGLPGVVSTSAGTDSADDGSALTDTALYVTSRPSGKEC